MADDFWGFDGLRSSSSKPYLQSLDRTCLQSTKSKSLLDGAQSCAVEKHVKKKTKDMRSLSTDERQTSTDVLTSNLNGLRLWAHEPASSPNLPQNSMGFGVSLRAYHMTSMGELLLVVTSLFCPSERVFMANEISKLSLELLLSGIKHKKNTVVKMISCQGDCVYCTGGTTSNCKGITRYAWCPMNVRIRHMATSMLITKENLTVKPCLRTWPKTDTKGSVKPSARRQLRDG